MSRPTLTVDTAGIIRQWSREAQALLGYDEVEALGQSIVLIIPEHLRGRHNAGFARFVQTGVSKLPEVVTTPAMHKSGLITQVLVSVKAVHDARQQIIAVEATMRPKERDD
jgi:PAS domain S-box-containing protein